MSPDEAILILKRDNPNNIAIRSGFEDLYDERNEAFSMAIKSLEQKSILDKIREEIHATAEMHEDGDYYLRDEWIDEIIDKYKVESEDKE